MVRLVRPAQLLTVRELAEHLAVSTATVYALVERGELAHVRLGNAIRFERSEVDHFVASRRR